MARTHLLPFSPHYDFVVVRPMTIDGVRLNPGDQMTSDQRDSLGERRLRTQYERRVITPVAPGAPAPVYRATVVAQVEAQINSASIPADSDAGGDDSSPPADDDVQEIPRIEKRAFGRWWVVTMDGDRGPMKKAEAETIMNGIKATAGV